jgi:hypothetical protein
LPSAQRRDQTELTCFGVKQEKKSQQYYFVYPMNREYNAQVTFLPRVIDQAALLKILKSPPQKINASEPQETHIEKLVRLFYNSYISYAANHDLNLGIHRISIFAPSKPTEIVKGLTVTEPKGKMPTFEYILPDSKKSSNFGSKGGQAPRARKS